MIKLSNAEIYSLIFLVFYIFVKNIFHFYFGYSIYNSKTIYGYSYHVMSDTTNLILLILGFYLLFFQGIKQFISFFIVILLLFKSIIHFFSDYNLYSKIFTPNKKIEAKIDKLHIRASEIVDPIIIVICLILLYKIYV